VDDRQRTNNALRRIVGKRLTYAGMLKGKSRLKKTPDLG